MTQGRWLWLISIVFLFSGAFVVRVNSLPHFEVTPAVTAELEGLLAANGLQTRPMPEPRTPLLAAALRFALPACGADGFLLPVIDVSETDVQRHRFGEIGGAVYDSYPQRAVSKGGILGARAAMAIATFKAAIGLPAPRNGHTVLVLFMPKGCATPIPDLSAYWAVADQPIGGT
jgi:hypothetical protein